MPENENPFSDKDLSEIERMSRDLDRLAESTPEPPPAKKGRSKKETPPEETGEEGQEDLIEYDPEFIAMVRYGWDEVVINNAVERLNWTEPGPHWRSKTSDCIARMIQRRMAEGKRIPDWLILLSYTALWAGPNMVSQFTSGGPAPTDDDQPTV